MFDRWALMKRNEFLEKQNEELEAEKKALMEENEELKEMLESTKYDLFYTREQNRFLSESLADLQNEKRKDLEKRIADLEEQLAKKVYNCTPIKSFTLTGKLTVMNEPAEELEVGKWYDARTFDIEKLKRLLQVGTLVEITTSASADERVASAPQDCIVRTRVTSVEKENNRTVLYVERYKFVENNWFKIIEE